MNLNLMSTFHRMMLLFAHLGLTLAAGRLMRWVDLAFLALGSMLPWWTQNTPQEGKPYKPYIQGNIVLEKIYKTDDFTQAGERYRSLNKTEQEHMAGNLVADLSHVTDPAIQKRAIENLRQADENLATSVARGLGLEK